MSSAQLYASLALTALGMVVIFLGKGGSKGNEIQGQNYNTGAGLVMVLLGIGLAGLYFTGTSLF